MITQTVERCHVFGTLRSFVYSLTLLLSVTTLSLTVNGC